MIIIFLIIIIIFEENVSIFFIIDMGKVRIVNEVDFSIMYKIRNWILVIFKIVVMIECFNVFVFEFIVLEFFERKDLDFLIFCNLVIFILIN